MKVPWKFHESYMKVTRKLHESYVEVTWQLHIQINTKNKQTKTTKGTTKQKEKK